MYYRAPLFVRVHESVKAELGFFRTFRTGVVCWGRLVALCCCYYYVRLKPKINDSNRYGGNDVHGVESIRAEKGGREPRS